MFYAHTKNRRGENQKNIYDLSVNVLSHEGWSIVLFRYNRSTGRSCGFWNVQGSSRFFRTETFGEPQGSLFNLHQAEGMVRIHDYR